MLHRQLSIPRATLYRRLDHLERAGLITRNPYGPVTITSAGIDTLAATSATPQPTTARQRHPEAPSARERRQGAYQPSQRPTRHLALQAPAPPRTPRRLALSAPATPPAAPRVEQLTPAQWQQRAIDAARRHARNTHELNATLGAIYQAASQPHPPAPEQLVTTTLTRHRQGRG